MSPMTYEEQQVVLARIRQIVPETMEFVTFVVQPDTQEPGEYIVYNMGSINMAMENMLQLLRDTITKMERGEISMGDVKPLKTGETMQ